MNAKIPRGIWTLGWVSLFMDTSSELIHSLLPIYMVTILHANMTFVGLIEGVAEATSLIVKIFSGYLSDFIGKRKSIIVLGYAISAISKPFFPLAKTLDLVFFARTIDRIGKGVRGAPRDAMIGDIAPVEVRGASYGLRQSLDTAGAILGPIFAILLMLLFNDVIRSCLWFAIVPAFISVGILVLGVKEPTKATASKTTVITLKDFKNLNITFWHLTGIGVFITLARFSEAFLILKAQKIELSLAWVPLVLVIMNGAYFLSSYPAGFLSDKFSRKIMLMGGIGFLSLADLFLALSENYFGFFLGIVLWGLHMGFSQGLLAAMVVDSTPSALRGSAFGIFNFTCGIALFFASFLAGFLWDLNGSKMTFLVGGCFSLLSLALLIPWQPKTE